MGIDANDVGLHAFYPIPAHELGAVVDELRALAVIQGSLVRRPWASTGAGRGRSRGRTVCPACGPWSRATPPAPGWRGSPCSRSMRSGALNWGFRGVERQGSEFRDIAIPDVRATEQRVLLVGAPSYETRPAADVPAGFALALDGGRFIAANPKRGCSR